jgi:hypothetical protein
MATSDHLDRIASIHRFLRGIISDTLTESIEEIVQSECVRSENGICQIASGILSAVNPRPLNIAILA